MGQTVENKFAPTIEGCKEAQKYLKDQGLWTPRVERMDGYSQVFYANEVFAQGEHTKTK